MGKRRHKYNKEDDQQVEISNNTKDILKNYNDASDDVKGVENDSNHLIISGNDKVKKRKFIHDQLPKKLSKKERKKLEKVLDQKKKKERRAGLLENLAKFQVGAKELAMLDSVAHMGTKNSKLTSLSKRPLPKDLADAVGALKPAAGGADNDGEEGVVPGRSKRRKLLNKQKQRRKMKRKMDQLKKTEEREKADEEEEEEEDSSSEEEEQQSDVTGADKIEAEDTSSVAEKPETVDGSAVEQKKKDAPVATQKKKDNPKGGSTRVEPTAQVPAVPTTYIHVERTPEIQESRLRLPILAQEQTIMETIRENSICIVCGETGSGKTTQIPQFLYEAGYAERGMIGVTEPRRVAAVSMSNRVATEMNLPSSVVSYHIRYDKNTTSDTKLKFMTDGVLTREIKSDFLLTKYSVIVLDEAHERTANTDLLVGLLSRVVSLREKKGKPLKLIIMSATLRIEDFTNNTRLFKTPPPVCKIEVRQFPVTVHFNKRTPGYEVDGSYDEYAYLNEACNKICKIHRTLPPGGILVFVTGKQEVHALKRRLNNTFPTKSSSAVGGSEEKKTDKDGEDAASKLPDVKLDSFKSEADKVDSKDIENDDSIKSPTSKLLDSDAESDSEIMMDDSAYSKETDSTLPLYVLPMYSMLPAHKQKEVFQPVPEGCRLCVVATNVAETSLTIPGIKYVVDTGKVKRKVYDKITGISSFQVSWISKASADQRAGRAGRTSAGHAYRLYSSAVFQDLQDFDLPEIASRPLADLVLQMKAMNIDRVVNFPFPTSPSLQSLEAAESLLISLGCIDAPDTKNASLKDMKKLKYSGRINEFGRKVASFPIHPRYGKMIVMATESKENILSYIITIVAALTVGELFTISTAAVHENENDEESDEKKSKEKEVRRQLVARLRHLKTLWSGNGVLKSQQHMLGDLMVMLGAIGAAEYSGGSNGFCNVNCLRSKAVSESRKLRRQLTEAANSIFKDCDICMDPKMPPPTDKQVEALRQVFLSAMGDHVARKIDEKEKKTIEEKKNLKGAYYCLLIEEPVFIHPESVLSREPLPDYVIFQEISNSGGKKTYMRDVTAVEPNWLPKFASQHCTFSPPLEEPEPSYADDVVCHSRVAYGKLSWPLGQMEISYPPSIERFRWFARFLLEGKILPSFKKFDSLYMSRPCTMTKSWANLQPRTTALLNTLISKSVDSKEKLIAVFKEHPDYLKAALLEWLPPSAHSTFLSWPPKEVKTA